MTERLEELVACLCVARDAAAYWEGKIADGLMARFSEEERNGRPAQITRGTARHVVTVTYPAGNKPTVTVEDRGAPVCVCPIQMCAEV